MVDTNPGALWFLRSSISITIYVYLCLYIYAYIIQIGHFSFSISLRNTDADVLCSLENMELGRLTRMCIVLIVYCYARNPRHLKYLCNRY